MTHVRTRFLALLLPAVLVSAAVAVLNLGSIATSAAAPECTGGGGSPSSSPSGSSASPSSSPSASTSPSSAPLPRALQSSTPSPSASTSASPTASPSPSSSGGVLPTIIPTGLPTGGGSQSPSASGSPSPAGERSCSSEITLKFGRKGFKGAVTSGDDGCEDGRSVFLLRDRKKKKDVQVGGTITDTKGGYTLPAKRKDVEGKTFYSKTPKEKIPASGATDCGAAKSDVVKP